MQDLENITSESEGERANDFLKGKIPLCGVIGTSVWSYSISVERVGEMLAAAIDLHDLVSNFC